MPMYRIVCEDCSFEQVLTETEISQVDWVVKSKYKHNGICPSCNPSNEIRDDRDSKSEKHSKEVPFENLDSIGKTGAENLRKSGIVTYGDVKEATEEEILSVDWVGKSGLKSIEQELGTKNI